MSAHYKKSYTWLYIRLMSKHHYLIDALHRCAFHACTVLQYIVCHVTVRRNAL